jgi:hypothetical protein
MTLPASCMDAKTADETLHCVTLLVTGDARADN